MSRADLEAALVDLFDRAGELAAPDRATVRTGVSLVLRAVALGGTPRGDRARVALEQAHRAALSGSAPVEAALVAPPPARAAVRPAARHALTLRRRSTPARTEA